MKAVLFDFDFTLADSKRPVVDCFRYALKSVNLPVPSEAVIISTFGMALPDAFGVLAPASPPESLQKYFMERADQVVVEWTTIYEPVPGLLQMLHDREYKTGIISTKYRYRIEAILKRAGLLADFDVIIGWEDVKTPKPDPEGLFSAIGNLRCDPSSVLYVGDSTIDARTAQAAGVKFVGVTTGPASREELWNLGALAVISGLDQFMPTLDEIASVA